MRCFLGIILITIHLLNSQVHKVDSWIFEKTNNTLNCFGIKNTLFNNILQSMFTEKTRAEDVKFYFYSRERSGETTVRSQEKFNLEDLPLNVDRTTMVLVHGFMSSGKAGWIRKMKDALLKLNNFNVIVVNWQEGSNTWNYLSASISTRIVGVEVFKLFKEMKRQAMKLWPERRSFGSLHFVGHSLGAHISAHASYKIREDVTNEQTNWLVGRITGLDPAQPCFTEANPILKLDSGDAEFVDVIHTNAKNIFLLGFGLPGKIGHMDFYPDGGRSQIACDYDDASFWNFLQLPIGIIKEAICSHGHSHVLFTDSINVEMSKECMYVGHEWDRSYDNLTKLLEDDCENICTEMGVNAVKFHPQGDKTFFVQTAVSAPYCVVSRKDRLDILEQLQHDRIAKKSVLAAYADKIL